MNSATVPPSPPLHPCRTPSPCAAARERQQGRAGVRRACTLPPPLLSPRRETRRGDWRRRRLGRRRRRRDGWWTYFSERLSTFMRASFRNNVLISRGIARLMAPGGKTLDPGSTAHNGRVPLKADPRGGRRARGFVKRRKATVARTNEGYRLAEELTTMLTDI